MPEECFKCSAILAADNWVPHQQAFHLWHPEKVSPCMNCPYTSRCLANFFGHLLLEGHQIKAPVLLEKRDDLMFASEPALKKVKDMVSNSANNSNDSPKPPFHNYEWVKNDPPITVPNPFDNLEPSTVTVLELSDQDEQDMSTNSDSSPESPNQIPEFLDVSGKAANDTSEDSQSPASPNTSTTEMPSLSNQNLSSRGLESNDEMAATVEPKSMDAWDMSRRRECDILEMETCQAASEANVISGEESEDEVSNNNTDYAATSRNSSTQKEGEEMPTAQQRNFETFTCSNAMTKVQHPLFSKSSAENGPIQCAKCSVTISADFCNQAVTHVKACQRIRPFACSYCHVQYSEKSNLQKHFNKTKSCPKARIELVEKERNETVIRKALLECFPTKRFNWQGLTNQPQKRQSQCMTSTEKNVSIFGSTKESVISQKNSSQNTKSTDQSQKQLSMVTTTKVQTLLKKSSMPALLAKELETIPDKTSLTIKCDKCRLEIKVRKEYRLTKCVQHVLVCLRLRSYQCTWCHYATAFKSTVRVHLQQSNKCRGAEVQMKDQKVDNEGVRRGLRECFPDNKLWM